MSRLTRYLNYRNLDRLPFLLAGIGLFLVKYASDWLIATQLFKRSWSPFNYLVWPDDRLLRVYELDGSEQRFTLTLLGVSLPFIAAGVILSLQRLRAAGLPRVLVLLFFVPLLNLVLFAVLILLPTQSTATATDSQSPEPAAESSLDPYDDQANFASGLIAVAVTVPLAVMAIVFGAQALQSYGFGLFVGVPFGIGMLSSMLCGISRPRTLGACFKTTFASTTLTLLAILFIAVEGLICLIMAAPIVYAVALLGALVGYAIQARPRPRDQAASLMIGVILLVPMLMAAESAKESEPALRAVRTEVIIDAPPDQVWPHVVAFPALSEPDEWLFRAGIAYPQRAEIHGTGVGAVRHCIFTTGTFVEPIDVWDPPRRLRFQVTEQPEPMREWSPYAIQPAHLHDYLRSRQGEFRLEELPDGRTLLIGTTWYTNRMWPAAYWNLWSDHIIHRIHSRVLVHIKQRAEAAKR